MTNWTRKVRKGVIIFDKRILVLVSSSRTQCFTIQPHLHQSFPCSRQSLNWYFSASCSGFVSKVYRVPVSFGKREGEEKCRENPPSLHYYFIDSGKREREENHIETPPSLHYYFFQSGVYFHVIPHRVLFSHKKLVSCLRTWLF